MTSRARAAPAAAAASRSVRCRANLLRHSPGKQRELESQRAAMARFQVTRVARPPEEGSFRRWGEIGAGELTDSLCAPMCECVRILPPTSRAPAVFSRPLYYTLLRVPRGTCARGEAYRRLRNANSAAAPERKLAVEGGTLEGREVSKRATVLRKHVSSCVCSEKAFDFLSTHLFSARSFFFSIMVRPDSDAVFAARTTCGKLARRGVD